MFVNLLMIFINKVKVWGVYVVIVSGVILVLLVLFVLVDNKLQVCLFWFGLVLLVDGFDGILVCKYEVKEMLLYFDGLVFDLVIDYLIYVFILVIFIYCYIFLLEYFELLVVGVILVLLLFCFCNVNMKSIDNYFVGFLVVWNVVVVYFYVFDLYFWVNFVMVLVLVVLILIWMKFFYLFCVCQFMLLNIVVIFVWLISSGLLIVQQLVDLLILFGLWFVVLVYFVGICFWCSVCEWFG